MDIHNSIMDIHNLFMDIHDCITGDTHVVENAIVSMCSVGFP